MAHFLKKIELNGFKSFAGKTILEFPAGIVAIIGPNGSGKSNIVDAIRWLLGERDAKNLRGSKTEDLIFAGTQKRPRVGMAQASLFFENSNSFFPVDFEEVTVTREVKRNGENKYLLNKSEILLRDLVDFFAKARLGSRGLIIIGQGESDLFIKATPLERREMIEEILGLREYQLKRTDASRRLKNSKINLDKAQALIEEILPHLRSLKRQTGRWEKREAIELELKNLENTFFENKLKSIAEKQKAIDLVIKENMKSRAVLDEKAIEAQKKQFAIESTQPKERKDLSEIKEQTTQILEKRNLLQKELGRIEAQIEILQESFSKKPVSERKYSVEKLLDLIKNIRKELQNSVSKNPEEFRNAISSLIKEIDEMLNSENDYGLEKLENQENIKLKFEIENLNLQLKKLTDELQNIEQNLKTLRENELLLEKSQEFFYVSFKNAINEVRLAKDKIEEWEKNNREYTLEKERLDLIKEEVIRQIEQAGRHIGEFSADLNNVNQMNELELQEIERRIFRLRGDLASIGDVDQALMKEAQETESRYEHLKVESEDLEKAVVDLTQIMNDLGEKIKTEFNASLYKINDAFNEFFGIMFGGGNAKLKVLKIENKKDNEEIDNSDNIENSEVNESSEYNDSEKTEIEGGIAIEVKLPRKKTGSLDMLSGGERSLIGIAALFAMISVSPPPFLVLDEVDAALDERNARRFAEMIKNFSKRTQFIVVTHNRTTMEAAEILYGVTLDEDGTSKVVSMKFDTAKESVA
jgi:chromosome segregation protein